MTSTPTDEVFQRFNFSIDQFISHRLYPSGSTRIVDNTRFAINSSTMAQWVADWPVQSERLLANFDMYQQFTIEEVTLTYKPRFPNAVAEFWPDNATSNPPAEKMYMYSNMWVSVVQDLDDAYSLPTAEEYYMVRDQPNCLTRRATEGFSYTFRPFVMDVIGQSGPSGVQNAGNAGATATMAPLNLTVPTPFKWFATKALDNNNLANLALNTSIQTLGVKIYTYAPFNRLTVNETMILGTCSVNVKFAFKYPEYRPIVNNIATRLSGSQLLNREEAGAITALLGDGYKLRSFDDAYTPVTDIGVVTKEAVKRSGADLTSDVGRETVKRLRREYLARYEPAESLTLPASPVEDEKEQT